MVTTNDKPHEFAREKSTDENKKETNFRLQEAVGAIRQQLDDRSRTTSGGKDDIASKSDEKPANRVSILPTLNLIDGRKHESAAKDGRLDEVQQTWMRSPANRVAENQRPIELTAGKEIPVKAMEIDRLHTDRSSEAKVVELNRLDNRSADHSTPDAVVRMPANFDPGKPINLLIYNHGWGSTARSAFKDNELDKQMEKAPPNTVLLVPEWQRTAGANNSDQGRFSDNNRFRNMLQEVFDKTPGLRGKTLNDVSGIDILSHSAGYKPSESEIYKNGLQEKVKSITLLDSNYDGTGFDKWLKDNVKDLASGEKQFHNFFQGTASQSKAQADRVEKMLADAGLPRNLVYRDYNNSNKIMERSEINQHPIIFKYSTVSKDRLGPHMSMPHIYSTPLEHSGQKATGHHVKPEQQLKPGRQAKPEQHHQLEQKKNSEQLLPSRPQIAPEHPRDRNDRPVVAPAIEEKARAVSEARSMLESPGSSIREKLQAMNTLYQEQKPEAGKSVHLKLNDHGMARDFRIEKLKVGHKTNLLQMFALDGQGRSHPVLRAVERNGKVEQQRSSGLRVDYVGDWWSKNELQSNVGKYKKTDGHSIEKRPIEPQRPTPPRCVFR